MSKLTKKQKALVGKVDANKLYPVADALAFIPDVAPHAESLLKHKRIAVFGLYALPNTQLHEGDRIEILDELRFNPMDSRRRRAAHREKLRRSEGQKQVRRSRKQRNPV